MKIQEFDVPWKHYIIDDVLDTHDFELVQSVSNGWMKADSKNKINLNLKHFSLYKESSPFKEEAEQINKILLTKLIELTKIFNLENEFKQYFIEYVNCGNDYHYRVHRDTEQKVFTHVLYVSKTGNGTRLYTTADGKPVKEIPWKENRIVAFKNADNEAWHDYYSKMDNRITFNLVNVNFDQNDAQIIEHLQGNFTKVEIK